MIILKQKNTKNKSNKKRIKKIVNFLSKKNLLINIIIVQFIILFSLVMFNVLVIRENTKYNVENNNLLVKFESRWYVDYEESLQNPYETNLNKIIQIALNTTKIKKVNTSVFNPLSVVFNATSQTINSTATEVYKNGKLTQTIPSKTGIIGRAFITVKKFFTPKDTPVDMRMFIIGVADTVAQREVERRKAYAYYAQISRPIEMEVNALMDRQKSL
jgi:hypothetical protein